MFKSATFKLTAWYLAIVVAICLLFSIIIYVIATAEISSRIDSVQQTRLWRGVNTHTLDEIRSVQLHAAEANLIVSLLVTNICIWIAGGIGSHYLAKRTLHPIEEAHEAQSRFTSDASHELRTPLATMKTELEVTLRDPQATKSEMRDLLSSNLEEVDKLTKLAHTLLQLSRLDHENISQEKISLNKTAASIVERFNKLENRISITKNTTNSRIIGNQASIEELFTILIDNALKYSPEKSPIIITLFSEKQMTGFTITNEGEGIAPEILPHIFDRFYRADSSRTGGDKKGFGLGLSLAKKIVQLHAGELTVTSAPKEKTTFRVLLPRMQQTKKS